eukprot:scaffold27350_cov69-Phaeocystis_antarctica.AAC.3
MVCATYLVVERLEVELGLPDGVVRSDEVVVPDLHEEARRLLGQEDGPRHAPVELGVARRVVMRVRALLLVVVLAARLDRDEDVRLPRDLVIGLPHDLIGDGHVPRLPHDEAQLELLLDGGRHLQHGVGDGELVLEDLDTQHDAPLGRGRARVGEGARLLGQGRRLLHLLPLRREEAVLQVDERAAYLGLAEDAVGRQLERCVELRAEGRAHGPVARRAGLLLCEAVEDLEERLRLLAAGLGPQAVRSVDVDPHLAGVQ